MKDSVFNSLTVRVFVPFKDVKKIIKLAKEKKAAFVVLNVEPYNSDMSIMDLYLETAFSLYSLGKRVAYKEQVESILENEKDESNDEPRLFSQN